MPLDGTNFNQDSLIAFYRKNRESAIKLWKTIPEDNFSIRKYYNVCGTVACAIGWLALKEHDGWTKATYITDDDFRIPAPKNSMFAFERNDYSRTEASIQRYFGLSLENAFGLFTRIKEIEKFYNKTYQEITLSDVIEQLSLMPYTVHKQDRKFISELFARE